jgi:hypothetical protein
VQPTASLLTGTAVKPPAARTDNCAMELLGLAAVLFVSTTLYVMRRRSRQGRRKATF